MARANKPMVAPARASDTAEAELAVSLGRAIKILRTERGWSREELARQADVSLSLVAHLENARRPLSFAVMERLTSALGVRPSDLYSRAEKINVVAAPASGDENSDEILAELCHLMASMSPGDAERLMDLARRLAG